MQAVFLDNWIKATGQVLHGTDYFPELTRCGHAHAQMFHSSPSGGAESMHLKYLLASTAAERSRDFSISYFLPDRLTIRALTDARGRGVRVRIIVPGRRIDQWLVRMASHAIWGPLLRAGVEIYEYQPTMFHCKAMIVDRRMVSVGSTNFDGRSFRLNDEANLNVYDDNFADSMRAVFEKDLLSARGATLAGWQPRARSDRLIGEFAMLFRSQL